MTAMGVTCVSLTAGTIGAEQPCSGSAGGRDAIIGKLSNAAEGLLPHQPP